MGNQMARALVDAGLAEPLKPKKPRKGKEIICRKCGKPMYKPDYANIAVCQHCDKQSSYIVFNN